MYFFPVHKICATRSSTALAKYPINLFQVLNNTLKSEMIRILPFPSVRVLTATAIGGENETTFEPTQKSILRRKGFNEAHVRLHSIQYIVLY